MADTKLEQFTEATSLASTALLYAAILPGGSSADSDRKIQFGNMLASLPALKPSAAGTVDAGSALLPFRDLYLAGSSGTPGTNNYQITGTATAPRVITLPDLGGTVTLLGNTTTGTGSIVRATSPTLATPVLGVATATSINKVAITAPATSATLTIADGKTLTASNTITLAAGADGQTFTFPATGGTVTVLGNSTTGTGDIVRAMSPTLVTPALGVATVTSVNKITVTAPATGATLTVADGKTATVNNTLTFAGTDGTTITFQGTDTYVGRATTDTLTNKTLTTPTISGAISFPDGVRQTFNPDGTTPGLNVGSNAGDPSTPSNGDIWYDSTGNLLRARISGATVSLGAAGSSPPFDDGTAILKGSADATKLLRFEVDGFTTGTTRVITPPNSDTTLPIASQVITIAGPTAARTYTFPDAAATIARTDAAQTFTGAQTFSDNVFTNSSATGTKGRLDVGDLTNFDGNGWANSFRVTGNGQGGFAPSIRLYDTAANQVGQVGLSSDGAPSSTLFLRVTSGANTGENFNNMTGVTIDGNGYLTLLASAGLIRVPQTITASGTTGNQTINKMAGTVNVATGGSSVTVTNSLVTTDSQVIAFVRTNDSTAQIKNCVPGSGSFTITLTAAVTAETSVGFIVFNR